MDVTDTLSFSIINTSYSLKTNDVPLNPYSFVYSFDPNFFRANSVCFLGEKVPIKLSIIGYFHEGNCPIEIAAAPDRLDQSKIVQSELPIFSFMKSRNLSVCERSSEPKRFNELNHSFEEFIYRPHNRVYEIVVEHGKDRWIIFKRHSQIFALYLAAKCCLREAHKFLIKRSQNGKHGPAGDVKWNNPLPPVPKRSKNINRSKHFSARKKIIGRFLSAICEQPLVRNVRELLNFLEVSHFSFVQDLGCKQKEGFVLKLNAYGRLLPFGNFKKRWFIVKDTWVGYLKRKHRLGGVLLMDKDFEVLTETDLFRKYCFSVRNGSSQYWIKCFSEFDKLQFLDDIDRTFQSTGSAFVKAAPNGSFAPVRENVPVQWYVNGTTFFEALANTLEAAREEIFIAGSYLSPKLQLKHDTKRSQDWRLHVLLKRKANEGVRVFILLPGKFDLVRSVDSGTVENVLGDYYNIKILRHPSNSVERFHHEKLVIVDQSTAFVGGIDIVINRWNTLRGLQFDVDEMDDSYDENSQSERLSFPSELQTVKEIRNNNDSKNVRRQNRRKHPPSPRISLNKTKSINEASPTLRSPWHDVACSVHGECARDVGRHFIQRWNSAKLKLAKKDDNLPLLVPRSYEAIEPQRSCNPFRCSAQVLRSSSLWSAGIRHSEASIYAAILACIRSAEHCIYVENQFFISATDDQQSIKNEVARALVEKIVAMHQQGRTFRVFVVLPVLPYFEGCFLSRSVMYQQENSIIKGETSLLARLEDVLDDAEPSEYISFYGLRNYHCQLLTTDEVLVHSGLWIFDDREVILGSASLSDYSLLGHLNSEVSLHIKDTNLIHSRMNGHSFLAGQFARSLRMFLMGEHLGLDLQNAEQQLSDPVANSFYEKLWRKTALKNTKIFERVFHCCPSDKVRTMQELRLHRRIKSIAIKDPLFARSLLQEVHGRLVAFPLHFLSDVNMQPLPSDLEARLSHVS